MKKIAHTFSKLFFYGFTFVFLFVLLFSILSLFKYHLGWNIPFVELQEYKNSSFTFVRLPIINLGFGFPSGEILKMAAMCISLLFYVIYFYALKEFFKIFTTEVTFSLESLKKLNLFYKLNFIPVLLGIIAAVIGFFYEKKIRFDEEHFIVIIHLFIAFLIYLYLDLVKKGAQLQEENDLTI